MMTMMARNTVLTAVRVACVTAVCLVLAACGIRLETPPPSPLSPGANEVARQSAVDSILAIEAVALALDGQGESEEINDLISTIAVESRTYIDALGGPYDSGLEPQPTETSAAPIDQAVPPTIEDLHTMLLQSAMRMRATLALVPDDTLARLLSSTSLGHTLQAYELSDLTGLEINLEDLAAAEPPAAGQAASDVGHAAPEATDATSTPGPGEADGSNEDESPVATRQTRDTRVPVDLPEGLAAEQLLAVIVDEDALGYLQEILASRLSGDAREQELASAAVHRGRAADWAELAELSFTEEDPRQLRYHIRAELGGDEVVDELQEQVREQLVALTNHYVSLVPEVEPMDRTVLHDLALVTALEGHRAGLTYGPFPGMPDLSR